MWYCAHLIMAVRLKSGVQKELPVWENVFLLEAESAEIVKERASQIGRREEALSASSEMQCDGEPVQQVFVGVRKIIQVSTSIDEQGKFLDGAEVTYSQYIVQSEDDLMKLAKGDPVSVVYDE